MRKRLVSVMFAAVLMMISSISVLAAGGTSSKGLEPAVSADVDAQKFTHKEWTGTDYTDLSGASVTGEDVFAINREDASLTLIPYADTATAAAAVWDYNAREESVYMQLLTGENEDWELTVFQNETLAMPLIEAGAMGVGYETNDADGWKTVQLPKSWTMQGFDFPIYTNVTMPWQRAYDSSVSAPNAPVNYNPVGLYRKTFTVDSDLKEDNRRVYIHFEGVESAYYVYVNGKEVGYSEDSFSPHRFDITDYLVEGENTLGVKVHKFCDGTWFEDQDMIYDGGIFRDVYLTGQALVQLHDYTVVTDLDENFEDATLNLSVDVRNLSTTAAECWKVEVDVLDEAGTAIVDTSIAVDKVDSNGTATFNLVENVNAPKLWSAEDPNLYALVLSLVDGEGTTVEVVSAQLGFREIGFTSTQVDANYNVTTTHWDPITINGERMVWRGVNRHDSDPFNGKYVSQEVMEEDIRIMQENNINSIRTSHYSNDSYLYWLCNKYGMYMMAETNLECHALQGGSTANNNARGLFYELCMDRTETTFERLKNHPAIVSWSIGNELAYTSSPTVSNGMFPDMIWYFKDNDGTRPVHSESQAASLGVDMASNMYPTVSATWGRAGAGKIPYVLCEYVHAMGNSVGSIKEYWDAIRSSDNMVGAFIWDWTDQSRALSLSEGDWAYYATEGAHENLYADENDGYFYAYGGDFGESPNDDSFCQNGIVSSDRTVQPEMAEVKYQYQNFWFSADANQMNRGEVTVLNENSFTNLNQYDVKWELIKNGLVVAKGDAPVADVGPWETATISVPYEKPTDIEAGDEYYLNIYVLEKEEDADTVPVGTVLAHGQISVPVEVEQAEVAVSEKEVTVTQTEDGYLVEGEAFSFIVDKTNGTMKNYTYQGEVLIEQGPYPSFMRGYVENDFESARRYKAFDANWKGVTDNISVTDISVSENEAGQSMITADITFPDAGNTKESIIYTINGEGEVTVDMTVDATSSGLGGFIRVGSMMTLPAGFENVVWYGNGPDESFNDRSSNCLQGIWTNTVSGFFYPFMAVDDCGNLTEVKWIAVQSDSHKNSVLVSAATSTIEASALHFTPDDLNATDHFYGLNPSDKTYLHINYGSLGTGTGTCGPAALPEYRLPSTQVYNWEFTIIPTASTEAEDYIELSKPYRTVDSFDQNAFDKEAALEVISMIDSFALYDASQAEELAEIKAAYDNLTDNQKAIVNKNKDYEAILEAYENAIKELEGKTLSIVDQSKNAITVPVPDTATISKRNNEIVLSGEVSLGSNEVFEPTIAGKNSFTVEITVTPTGSPSFNQYIGKGDHAFTIRSTPQSLDFFVYAGGKWVETNKTISASTWLNTKHQIAGIYDAEANTISLYVDGALAETQSISSTGIASTDYEITIGACPEVTERKSQADFHEARLYNKALTVDELKTQNTNAPTYGPDHEAVELWIDFDTVAADVQMPTVNKAALRAAVKAEKEAALAEADYTEDTWKAYADALAAAEALIENEEATQETIDAAVTALAEAKAGLKEAVVTPPPVDKGENIALKAAASGSYASGWMVLQYAGINDGIDTIPDGGNGNDYAWATWGNTTGSEYIQYNWDTVVEITGADLYIWDDNPNDLYTGVDTPASLVYEYLPDGSSEWVELAVITEGIIGGAAGELNEVTFEEPVKAAALRVTLMKNMEDGVTEAQEGVGATEWKVYGTDTGVAVTVPVDKAALEAAVAAEKEAALVAEDYTEETWKVYADALAAADALIDDADATQEAVDAAVAALEEAKEGLEKVPVVIPVDKAALQEAVDAAEALKAEDYTEKTWEAYQAVLADAKAVLADEEATQTAVDEAAETLVAAAELLRLKLPYVDVAETDWFYESVYYNYIAKTMTGMDETHFGPYGQLSRAQFALILYRIEGEPAVETDKTFLDISGDEWYGQAVLWAAENGIVTGYENGCYGPVDLITREQMAVMMYRYAFYISQCEAHPFRDAGTAKYLKEDVTATGDLSTFNDVESVSEFAKEAMSWANGKGIITGKENGTMLDPQGNTARCEAAAIIERFMK